MPFPDFNKICLNIDWNRLHKQKEEILTYSMDNDLAFAIEGILELFNSLQDHAELLGLWEYPEDEEDCDSGYYELGDADRSP